MNLKRVVSIVMIPVLLITFLFVVSCTSDDKDKTGDSVVRVIKATKDLTEGTIISVNDIDIVEVENTDLPEGYIKSSSDAVGRKLLSDLKKDDIITSAQLSSKVYNDGDSTDLTVSEARARGYVVVTDYIKNLSSMDLSGDIQNAIDDNPNSTIYFPDGVYTILKPIKTSSHRTYSVALHLSANAVIKASDYWGMNGSYMIQIGVKDKEFTIDYAGTNYYMYGGTIDCNGSANGVELSGGREISLRNVTIKNAYYGMHIAYNEEYGSNDSDTEWVNIEGNGKAGSIGVLVDGLDNTLTNIRVSGFETGARLTRGGNLMHNINVTNIPSDNIEYDKTKGFWDTSGGNWYDGCRADDYRTAFFTAGTSLSIYNSCTAFWSQNCGKQYAFETDGALNATITELKAIFVAGSDNAFLVTQGSGGNGMIKNPIFDTRLANNDAYKRYLVGHVVSGN